jgi:hypothetical protein
MFFTAMLDEDTTYSETGATYHQDFCWPNYTGSNVPPVMLTESQRNMSETDDWTYVDFNLYEIEKYGYSIWGTSSFLGSLRFQTGYKNTSEEDWSNEFLIKAIIAGDIDKMEALGIYEVAPEDFAAAEFVCSSKMELQKIVRKGLDLLRKEMC